MLTKISCIYYKVGEKKTLTVLNAKKLRKSTIKTKKISNRRWYLVNNQKDVQPFSRSDSFMPTLRALTGRFRITVILLCASDLVCKDILFLSRKEMRLGNHERIDLILCIYDFRKFPGRCYNSRVR